MTTGDTTKLFEDLETLKKENDTLKKDYAILKEENESLKQSNEILLNDNLILSQKVNRLTNEQSHFENHLTFLQLENEINKKEYKKLFEAFSALQSENTALKTKIDGLIKENAGLKTQIYMSNKQIEELKSSVSDLLVNEEAKEKEMKKLHYKIDALTAGNHSYRKNLYDKNKQKTEGKKQLIAYARSSSMANYYLGNILLPQLKSKFKTEQTAKLFKWNRFKHEFNKHPKFVEFAKTNHQVDLEEIRKLKDERNDIIHDGQDEASINDIVALVQQYKGSLPNHLNVINKMLDEVKIDINNVCAV
ncbi:hypothetical protein ACTFIW_010971 [Dictyostelium discoideum]